MGRMHMSVPLLSLDLQHRELERELKEAFAQVLAHGKFILGPEMEMFEKEIAALCKTRYAVGCANGSDALLLAMMAFDIGPGDEVITTPYSFFATVSCITRLGAKPVFVDIQPCCFNIDPDQVLKKISSKTKAIIPVHLFGQSADMSPYLAIAKEKGIRIVEDAAQSLGAEYQGKPSAGIGDIGSISFYPSKNLGGLGDGGILVTNDEATAVKLKKLRNHGAHPKYYHQFVGMNSRLDTIQAALLRVKLPHLSGYAEKRKKNAEYYIEKLTQAGIAEVTKHGARSSKPVVLPGLCQSSHVYNQFVIRVRDLETRESLRKHLVEQKIGTEIYYPVPLHLQDCFKSLGYKKADFPESEQAADTTLALPIYPELTAAQLQEVVDVLLKFAWAC
jgi:dTDP-4-amino-4,6-dideoxygalactose transaminase